MGTSTGCVNQHFMHQADNFGQEMAHMDALKLDMSIDYKGYHPELTDITVEE